MLHAFVLSVYDQGALHLSDKAPLGAQPNKSNINDNKTHIISYMLFSYMFKTWVCDRCEVQQSVLNKTTAIYTIYNQVWLEV